MQRNLKSYLTKNWGLKLASFLVALVVWLTLIPEEKTFTEKSVTVALEIHNRPANMVLMERPPQTVDVTIRAPNRLLPQITAANTHVVLDLTNASVEQTQYTLSRSMVSVPLGAEVKDVFPSQVSLKLEMTKEVLVDVEPVTTGTIPEGFKLVKIECEPPQVQIRGPESKINDKIKVRTIPINITELTESTNIRADVILPDPDLVLAMPDTTVVVRLIIEAIEVDEKAEIKQ